MTTDEKQLAPGTACPHCGQPIAQTGNRASEARWTDDQDEIPPRQKPPPGYGWWTVTVHELADGRLVIGGEQDGTSWLAWLVRLQAAVEREIAGELTGYPGMCAAALRVPGDGTVASH